MFHCGTDYRVQCELTQSEHRDETAAAPEDNIRDGAGEPVFSVLSLLVDMCPICRLHNQHIRPETQSKIHSCAMNSQELCRNILTFFKSPTSAKSRYLFFLFQIRYGTGTVPYVCQPAFNPI